MSLVREQERYQEWLEDNPPIQGDGGWLCPTCDNVHRTEDDAAECCIPDEQDMDCQAYHSGGDR
jgi:hypothetical protein